jgi:hypothetical protein
VNTTTTTARNLLEWVFSRGSEVVTCQLSRIGDRGGYMLRLMSLWDEQPMQAERFESGLVAFQRHAALATTLRDCGWKVVSYTA